jgi:hypothetical protein
MCHDTCSRKTLNLLRCLPSAPVGITAYLKNGDKLEIAQQMAAHESTSTSF